MACRLSPARRAGVPPGTQPPSATRPREALPLRPRGLSGEQGWSSAVGWLEATGEVCVDGAEPRVLSSQPLAGQQMSIQGSRPGPAALLLKGSLSSEALGGRAPWGLLNLTTTQVPESWGQLSRGPGNRRR